jgi:ABC-2 type transport system ATP-binding protein
MISVTNLRKWYGKIVALDNVSILFENAKVTAIMGENGAGKTTLLKICAGILSYESGEVLVDGFSIVKDSMKARERIGYLPEMPMMYERLTGKEFLFYIASLRKLANAMSEIDRLSRLLGIDRFLEYEIGTYSKGMKQKLSIITAIMHSPANLLLDEPVWGLDPLTSRALKKFIAERKGTTILATHSPEFVEEVADIVYILMRGRLVARGDVDFFVTKYGSMEEAYFHAEEGKDAGDVYSVAHGNE